jgi:hypothetical protein
MAADAVDSAIEELVTSVRARQRAWRPPGRAAKPTPLSAVRSRVPQSVPSRDEPGRSQAGLRPAASYCQAHVHRTVVPVSRCAARRVTHLVDEPRAMAAVVGAMPDPPASGSVISPWSCTATISSGVSQTCSTPPGGVADRVGGDLVRRQPRSFWCVPHQPARRCGQATSRRTGVSPSRKGLRPGRRRVKEVAPWGQVVPPVCPVAPVSKLLMGAPRVGGTEQAARASYGHKMSRCPRARVERGLVPGRLADLRLSAQARSARGEPHALAQMLVEERPHLGDDPRGVAANSAMSVNHLAGRRQAVTIAGVGAGTATIVGSPAAEPVWTRPRSPPRTQAGCDNRTPRGSGRRRRAHP